VSLNRRAVGSTRASAHLSGRTLPRVSAAEMRLAANLGLQNLFASGAADEVGQGVGAKKAAVHRSGEQVALTEITPRLAQDITLGRGFDPLGNDGGAVDARDLQQYQHQLAAIRDLQPGGEIAVDLDRVDAVMAQR